MANSMEKAERILTIEALRNSLKFGKASYKPVLGKLMRILPECRKQSSEIEPILKQILDKINNWNDDQRTKELLKLDPNALTEEKSSKPEEKVLPDLPNAIVGDSQNPVVMRLAPYPSGALHIGNARMIVLNDEYVKKYKGNLILCFDDTIGATQQAIDSNPKAKYIIPEAYDLITEGLTWLEINYDKENVIYKSDRVEIYKKYASQLIDNGDAYVCTCEPNVFRDKYKKTGHSCPCRSLEINVFQERWEKMNDGSFEEGEAVVRLKTGMDQKDPALRDHIIMRISDAIHPRIGKKCRVWPLLDFSWGIDDHELGITHILRGVDLQKEGIIEEFIWDLMGWPKKEILLYGRMKFSKDFRLSKTESRLKIMSGEYESWSDPRTWSLQSLKERGIHPNALRESLIDLGMSKSGINFSENWIYAKNAKIIDPTSNRYWFVENPIPIEISGLDKELYVSRPLLNPNNVKKGKRIINLQVKDGRANVYISKLDIVVQKSRKGDKVRYPKIKAQDKFRLKDLFTIEVDEINSSCIKAHFLEKESDKNIRKIQWVPKDDNCKVKILKPNGDLMEGFAEAGVKNLKKSTILQFERYGFVRIKNRNRFYTFCYFTQ